MSKQVTIAGQTYILNQQGDPPPHGEDLSDLLQALVDVAATVSAEGDIATTSFTIANNVSSVANVTGLLFDTSSVRSSVIEYSVYRATTTNEVSECGTMLITYKSTSGTWELAQYNVGDSGVTFTITTLGQVQYVSTDVTGSSYSGTMKFRAKSFTQ